MERKAFLDQEAPPGYVAGIGRGAVGFTTSADTGAARFGFGDDDNENENTTDFQDRDENGLLQSKDDDEADQIYQEIEEKLKRRKRPQLQLEPVQENTILHQFSDLKRALTKVNDDEWANIPEVSDITRRNKRTRLEEQQQQRFYAVPDSVLGGKGGSINEITDFESISGAKKSLLSKQLDLWGDSTTEQSQDVAITLEKLNQESAQVQDIEKGRLILASLRRTEPNKASSWLASVRLEEQAKNYSAAKKLIIEACTKITRNDELWLTNIRIHQQTSQGSRLCKGIVNEALKYNSKSESLWLKAFELENEYDVISRRKILMKGLEFIPSSTELWKCLVDLEDSESDVKRLLFKAVELCPTHWDFWVSLIGLSQYQEAKSLLNRARKAMSDNASVWVTALQLEERENNNVSLDRLKMMLGKGFKELDKHTNLARSFWLQEAVKAHSDGFPKSSEAIVFTCLTSDAEDRKAWFKEAERMLKEGNPDVSHYIYEFIIQKFPNSTECWVRLFDSVKSLPDFEFSNLSRYYEQAIELNPKTELFSLMYAKDAWKLAEDVELARSTLEKANKRFPESEDVFLARVKLEYKEGHYSEAHSISTKSIETIPQSSSKIWYKHIHLERFLVKHKHIDGQDLVSLSDQALSYFPDCYKLYLQKSQIHLANDQPKLARETLSLGTRKIPSAVDLWIALSLVDEKNLGIVIRARSVLDSAILQNPLSDKLWVAKIKLEQRQKDFGAAQQMSNKALKMFPNSPALWIQSLSLIPKMSHRKNLFLDALKKTDNSAEILLSIGVFFWIDGKFSKSQSWFQRALDADPSNGDSWAWMYLYQNRHKSEKSFMDNFVESYDNIHKGDMWNSVNKDVANFDATPAKILQLVSEKIENSESFF